MDDKDTTLTVKEILIKYGFKRDISKIKDKKYSKWKETKNLPPVPSDLKEWAKIEMVLIRKDLSKYEKLILYIHNRTGGEGIEFSAFSDIQIENTTIFQNGMILMPCFESNLDGKSLKDPATVESMEQLMNSRFEYDCWIPVENYDELEIRNSIRNIDEVLSVFSLFSSRYFE